MLHYIYIGVIVSIVGASWYFLNDWHYKPLKQNKATIYSLETQLQATGYLLNTCEANLSKQLLKGFIDGVGGHNEDITISLDNLHT